MKTKSILSLLVLGLVLVSSVWAQGPLTPSGPPAPAMKTLQQIEPRIDLQRTVNPLPTDANTEIIVDQPGSYYLSANLVVTKATGIYVTAPGVTIDLNGFQITRSGATGGQGINVGAPRCTIRDGNITGFSNAIASAFMGVPSCSVLRVSANCGIVVGSGWLIQDCAVSGAGSLGISVGTGCTVRNCVITSVGSGGFFEFGIFAANYCTIEGCSVYDQKGTAGIFAQGGSTITHCTVGGSNVVHGIRADSGGTIARCTVSDLTNAAATSGGIWINGPGNVTGCTVRNVQSTNGTFNGGTGFGIAVAGAGTVEECSVQGNKGDGVRGAANSLIQKNLCTENGNGATSGGIHVTGSGNRIESNNLVSNNANGVLCDSAGNLIIKNSSRGGSQAFNIAPGNSKGEEINVFNANTTTTITSTNSWANFLY
jgi:hypothetical protein